MFLFPKSAHKIRLPAKHADGTINFQRVRISKARSRPLAFTVLALPLTILLLETSEYWLPDEYKKALQKARASTEDEKKRTSGQQDVARSKIPAPNPKVTSVGNEGKASGKQAGPQDVSLIIPLPIIQQRHPVPYNETDKEWIEASRLTDDPTRLLALKKLIVNETIKGWAKDKPIFESIKRVSRPGERAGVENSLEVVVPLFRPPKFDQHAIVWLPDGPRLAKIPLSNATASRINRIWHPKVFLEAFWNAGKGFTFASYQVAKNSVQGIGSSNTSVIAQLPATKSPHTTLGVPSSSPAKPALSTMKATDAAEKTDDQVMAFFLRLSKTITPEQPLAQAKMAFLKTFSALQVHALQHVPEGAVVFQGYVTFVGHRGKVKSTISAIYLPAQDRLILPVIIERTEILPNTAFWHQLDSKKQHIQPSKKLVGDNLETPQMAADFKSKVDQRAKLMGKAQGAFESFVGAQGAYMEKRRQELARDIQKLEGEMGGQADPDTKKQVAMKVHYSKKEGNGKLVEMLDSRSSTDPRLKQLIEQIATGGASSTQLKEFASYVDESNAIILAQEVESKGIRSDVSPSKPRQLSNEGPAIAEKDVNDMEDMKDVQSEKNDENEKSASNSVETPRKEERKKG